MARPRPWSVRRPAFWFAPGYGLASLVWKVMGHEDDAPGAPEEDRAWQEVLLAAALVARSSPSSRRPSTGQEPPPRDG